MQECLPYTVDWEELDFFAWKGVWGDTTKVYNITNIAENVIREGLGSVFQNPVKLLGLKQNKKTLSFLCNA